MSSAALSTAAPRRHLTARQAETARRLVAAARDELRAVPFEELTVRTVASRAGVAPATAYTYFASKSHLVAELFWRSICELARPDTASGTPVQRVAAVFRDLALFLAGEPEVARAATSAMLHDEPDVRELREMVGYEIGERLAEAAGRSGTPDVLDALGIAWSGAMLQAGMGHSDYLQMGERLAAVAELILRGAA